MRLRSCSRSFRYLPWKGLLRGISGTRRMIPHRPTRASRRRWGRELEDLDLNEARGARAPGRQARGDADALAGLAPAELDPPPRRIGDERLGCLVAAHGCRLDSPHEPASPDRLFPGRSEER